MSDFNDDFDPEELADAMEVERKGRREDRQLEQDIALLSRLALVDSCVHAGTIVYMNAEKRPRIDPDVVSSIEDERQEFEPFEHAVNRVLRAALPGYRIEPDDKATEPGLFRLVGDEENVVATGLTRRQADLHRATIDAAEKAYDALAELEDFLEDDPQHDEAYDLYMRVELLTSALLERYMPDAE